MNHQTCDKRIEDFWNDEHGNKVFAGDRCCQCYPHPSCKLRFEEELEIKNPAV